MPPSWACASVRLSVCLKSQISRVLWRMFSWQVRWILFLAFSCSSKFYVAPQRCSSSESSFQKCSLCSLLHPSPCETSTALVLISFKWALAVHFCLSVTAHSQKFFFQWAMKLNCFPLTKGEGHRDLGIFWKERMNRKNGSVGRDVPPGQHLLWCLWGLGHDFLRCVGFGDWWKNR